MYIRLKTATSTLQDKVEHIPSWMAKNKLNPRIRRPELVQLLSCRDKSGKLANTTIFPSKTVKYPDVHLDKNLSFEAHVESILGKMAKHVSRQRD